MTRTQLIALGSQPRTHQVPQRLMGCIRYPYRRQISSPVTASELLSIAPIGFNSIARFHRYERRGHHIAMHPKLRELTVQHVAGGPGLVAHPQPRRLAEPAYQPAHRFTTVRDNPQAAHLTSRLRYRHRNRLCMDIKPDKSYVSHRRLPFACGSAPRSYPIRSVIRDAANREPVVPF